MLQFFAEGRPQIGFPYGQQSVGVRIDGVPLSFGGSLTVSPPQGARFVPYTSDPFTLGAGAHTLTFSGLHGAGDNTAFIDLVTFAASPVGPALPTGTRLINGSFESPGLGTMNSSLQYNVSIDEQGGAGWTFNGFSGIAAVGSGFNVANTPDGTQAGFLQNLGNFSQTITTFDAGLYTLAFFAEGRPLPYGPQSVQVTLDGVPLAFGGALTVAPPQGATFVPYASDPFLLSAGPHTLTFSGLNGVGDNTAFIDRVTITAEAPAQAEVPEPTALALFGTGLVGLLGYGWRRRQPTRGPSTGARVSLRRPSANSRS